MYYGGKYYLSPTLLHYKNKIYINIINLALTSCLYSSSVWYVERKLCLFYVFQVPIHIFPNFLLLTFTHTAFVRRSKKVFQQFENHSTVTDEE